MTAAASSPVSQVPAGLDGTMIPRWLWFQWAWSLFGLLLIGVTWRLWTPQSFFPRVPLLDLAIDGSPAWDWVCFGLMAAALLAAPWLPAVLRPAAWSLLGIAWMGAVLTDQHRLQPWAYHLAISGMLLALAPPRTALRYLRVVAISVYAYSALSKFDYTFLHTVGQQFLDALLSLAGASAEGWPKSARLVAAALFPGGELLVAASLAIPFLRGIGTVAAIALHVALFVVLGPWGLDHEGGVLLWNVFFLTQAVILFAPSSWFPRPLITRFRQGATSTDAARGPDQATRRGKDGADEAAAAPGVEPRSSRTAWATCLTAAVVLWPLTEPWGWCDHWLAWGLYSPRNSRVVLEIRADESALLPAELQEYLEGPDDSWRRLACDRWSLETLKVPLYPQARFQWGVAAAAVRRLPENVGVRLHLLGIADRWTGRRWHRTFSGRRAILTEGQRFFLWNQSSGFGG